MSGSSAPIPDESETPDGMVHVGWYCRSPDHECVVPLSRADAEPSDGEVHLYDANHHASWVPMFVWRQDLDPDDVLRPTGSAA